MRTKADGLALFYVNCVNECLLSECIWQPHPVRAALGRPSECEDGEGGLRGTAARERELEKRLRLIPECGSGASPTA